MDLGADFGVLALAQVIGVVMQRRTGVLVVGGNDAQVQLATGNERGLAGAGMGEAGGVEVDVVTSREDQCALPAADIQTGDPVNAGAAGLTEYALASAALGGARGVDIALGLQHQSVVGMDAPAGVVDILICAQQDGGATQGAGVVEGAGLELHEFVGAQGAVVVDGVTQVCFDLVGGNQGAVVLQVAGAWAQVETGHEDLFDPVGLAVLAWEGECVLYQPDDVAGELRDLLCTERDPGAQ